MQSLNQIRTLLAARGVRPKHKYGQNFLHDQNVLRKLVAAADVQRGDVVLEVGPGTGTLTGALLDAGADVVAVDIDADMVGIVREEFGDRAGLTVLHTDVLGRGRTLSPEVVEALGGRAFRLVANLPYEIASPLMVRLLIDEALGCRGQVVTIQKEVADRLMASPGTKQYGPLGIIVQTFGEVELIARVKPGSFWPAPKVMSAMVKITPRGEREVLDAEAYAAFVTQVFTRRRKQLSTIFGDRLPAGYDPQARPETVSPPNFVALFQHHGPFDP